MRCPKCYRKEITAHKGDFLCRNCGEIFWLIDEAIDVNPIARINWHIKELTTFLNSDYDDKEQQKIDFEFIEENIGKLIEIGKEEYISDKFKNILIDEWEDEFKDNEYM